MASFFDNLKSTAQNGAEEVKKTVRATQIQSELRSLKKKEDEYFIALGKDAVRSYGVSGFGETGESLISLWAEMRPLREELTELNPKSAEDFAEEDYENCIGGYSEEPENISEESAAEEVEEPAEESSLETEPVAEPEQESEEIPEPVEETESEPESEYETVNEPVQETIPMPEPVMVVESEEIPEAAEETYTEPEPENNIEPEEISEPEPVPAAAVSYVFCTECGTKHTKGVKFCTECGTKLN